MTGICDNEIRLQKGHMVAMLGDAMIYLVGLALRYWLWAANVAGDRPEVFGHFTAFVILYTAKSGMQAHM